MEKRALRVLALFGFCIVFGSAVWTLDTKTNSRTSLAQVSVGAGLQKSATPQAEKPAAQIEECAPGRVIIVKKPDFKLEVYENILPKTECVQRVYNLEKDKYDKRVFSCIPSSGQCVCDQLASDVACQAGGDQVMLVGGGSSGQHTQIGSTAADPGVPQVGTFDTSYVSEDLAPQTPTDVSSGGITTGNTGGTAGAGTPGSSASTQIGTIANNTSGNTLGDSSNTQKPQTFSPSQSIGSGSAFNLGSLFSGLGGGSGGSSGGNTVVAYGPTGPTVYNNRNFDAVNSQVTFPEPRVTAADLIAEIGKKNPPPKVTAEELSDKTFAGKIADTVRTVGGTLLKPLGDLFDTAFAPGPGAEDEVAPEEAQEFGKPKEVNFEKQPLELDVLELMLVPGDPRIIFDPETFNLEDLKMNNNPFFDGALVRTNPWERAREIENAERATDSLSQGAPDGDGDMLPAPPLENFDTDTQEAMDEALESSQPSSAIRTMRETAKTVSAKVGELLKNIADTLFWWL